MNLLLLLPCLLVVLSTNFNKTLQTTVVNTLTEDGKIWNDRLDFAGVRLHEHIFNPVKHNRDTLPVDLSNSKLNIKILLKLVQLNDIDERNQVMTTTVWLRHEWFDSGLVWDPSKHGNITKMQLPAETIWLPDTVLYNNADGDYQITKTTKVKFNYQGHVIWQPPAIYKSFCAINVQFFRRFQLGTKKIS